MIKPRKMQKPEYLDYGDIVYEIRGYGVTVLRKSSWRDSLGLYHNGQHYESIDGWNY